MNSNMVTEDCRVYDGLGFFAVSMNIAFLCYDVSLLLDVLTLVHDH